MRDYMLGNVQMNDAIKNGDCSKILEYKKINNSIPANSIERATFYNQLETVKFLHDIGERCNFTESARVYSGNVCFCLCHIDYTKLKPYQNTNRKESISIDQVSLELREYFDSEAHNKFNCSWGKCLDSLVLAKTV